MSLTDDARAIIDANSFMTLGTADAEGRPWVSPVWFSTADPRELFWVSDPDARHSRNITARPQVAAVIFDSHAPIGTGEGVYMTALAGQLEAGDARDRALAVFSRRSVAQGGREPRRMCPRRPPSASTRRRVRALARRSPCRADAGADRMTR